LFGLVNFLLHLVFLASKLLDEVWWYWVHAARQKEERKIKVVSPPSGFT
jgi:hypothetical protein